jgi:hypothetical protein
MTWLGITSAAAIGFCGLLSASVVHAQDVPRAFICGNLAGSYSGPPTSWKPEEDGMSNQEVLLYFKGGKSISSVKWYRHDKVYYETSGIGYAMKSGFGIVVLAEDYIETYVVNVGTSELLFSMVRSGSSMHPNAIKTQRGACKPAGSMVR